MNTGKVLLGVVAGIAVGALLGVLFAPDKGCDTRRKIGQKKDDITDELKVVNDEVSDYTTKAEVKINEMKTH